MIVQVKLLQFYLIPHIHLLLLFLKLSTFHIRLETGLHIQVNTVGLPVGSGLGSSASLAVATAGALFCWMCELQFGASFSNEQLQMINDHAFSAEKIMHGNPSGLDNTVSTYGGAIRFIRKEETIECSPIPRFPQLDILLTNTHVPRSTKTLVAAVQSRKDHFPLIVSRIFDSIEQIVLNWCQLCEQIDDTHLSKSQYDQLSELVEVNHHLLCALGVGHPALTRVVDVTKEYGLATKLTGAGGGGCAVTVLPPNLTQAERQNFICSLTERLAECTVLPSSIGGSGILLHEIDSFP